MNIDGHTSSLIAGWSCCAVATFLIFQHVFSSPKVKRWPTYPNVDRLIIMGLIFALSMRGVNILSAPDEPRGVVPWDGAFVAIMWALYTGSAALRQYRAKRSVETLEALRRFDEMAADPAAPPVAEVLRRGVLGSLFARGVSINGVPPPRGPKEKPHD